MLRIRKLKTIWWSYKESHDFQGTAKYFFAELFFSAPSPAQRVSKLFDNENVMAITRVTKKESNILTNQLISNQMIYKHVVKPILIGSITVISIILQMVSLGYQMKLQKTQSSNKCHSKAQSLLKEGAAPCHIHLCRYTGPDTSQVFNKCCISPL